MIRANVEVDIDPSIQDLAPVQISAESNVPLERSKDEEFLKIANEPPLLRTQVRTIFESDNEDSSTGDSSPHLDEHPTAIQAI
ncbi:hypothetical protein KY285_023745 [Solanum tuberosum]|nr:hypothetical protein KY289_024079 [Solanum tuberosum]KAH0675944.1 hypothetical protein KY285_023745 [Solanum tuberosum]